MAQPQPQPAMPGKLLLVLLLQLAAVMVFGYGVLMLQPGDPLLASPYLVFGGGMFLVGTAWTVAIGRASRRPQKRRDRGEEVSETPWGDRPRVGLWGPGMLLVPAAIVLAWELGRATSTGIMLEATLPLVAGTGVAVVALGWALRIAATGGRHG